MRDILKGSDIADAMEKDKKVLELLSKHMNRTVQDFPEYLRIVESLDIVLNDLNTKLPEWVTEVLNGFVSKNLPQMVGKLLIGDREILQSAVQPLFKSILENMMDNGNEGKKLHVYSGTIPNFHFVAAALKVFLNEKVRPGDVLRIDRLDNKNVRIFHNFNATHPLRELTFDEFNSLSKTFVASNEEELCKVVESGANQSRFYNFLLIAIGFVYFLFH